MDEGVKGFVDESVDRAVAAVPRAAALDRSGVRRRFEERFSAERMALDYVELYDDVLRRSSIDAVVLSTRACGQREAAGPPTAIPTGLRRPPSESAVRKRHRSTSSRTSPSRSAGRAHSSPVIHLPYLITAAISSRARAIPTASISTTRVSCRNSSCG